MTTIEKLEFFTNMKPQIVTYDYLRTLKHSKRDGYTIYKESKNRLGYFGKKYVATEGREINEEREKQIFKRINKHIKQTISTKNILLEFGTIRNRKRKTIVTYYIIDANGKRELTLDELSSYLPEDDFEKEKSSVESRRYYTVNMNDITKINGVTL